MKANLLDAYVDVVEIKNPNLTKPEIVEALEKQGMLRDGQRIQNYTYSGDVASGRFLVNRYCTSLLNSYNGDRVVRGPFNVDVGWPDLITMELDQSGIDEGCADLLYGFVRAILPKVIFETGTHKGRSTHAMVMAMCDNKMGHITTVDMDDYEVLPKIFNAAQLARVTQVIGKSPEVLDGDSLKHVQDIEMAFLDGAHDGDTLLKEIEWVDKRRAPSCYVLIDNAIDSGWPEVRQVLNLYHKYPRIPIQTMAGTELIWMHGERSS